VEPAEKEIPESGSALQEPAEVRREKEQKDIEDKLPAPPEEPDSGFKAPTPFSVIHNKVQDRQKPDTGREFIGDAYAPGSGDGDISVEEVVESFSGTPLAELAEKINRHDTPEDEPDMYRETATGTGIPAPAADTGLKTSIKPEGDNRKQRKPLPPAVVAPLFICALTIGGVVTGILIKGGGTPRTVSKPVDDPGTGKSGGTHVDMGAIEWQVPEEKASVKNGAPSGENAETGPEETPEIAGSQPPALTAEFFTPVYSFRDRRYSGIIQFSGVGENSGTYLQQVKMAGREKVFSVKGPFRYDKRTITFEPRGAETRVVWRLENLDRKSQTAVFYDPRSPNRAASRIMLKKKD
jgi:hypothetical protein